MHNIHHKSGQPRIHEILFVGIAVTFMLTSLAANAPAGNAIDLTMNLGDTIWIGYDTYFSIWIENDVRLSGVCMGYRFSSLDGVTWAFDEVGGFDIDLGGGPRFIRGVAGSRWMSGAAADGSCWDLGGTLVNTDFAPAQFLIGGAAPGNGLLPGPMQRMLEIHLTVGGLNSQLDLKTLCLDSAFFPPAGSFIFVDATGPSIIPALTHHCWSVRFSCLPLPGDATGWNGVDLADAVCIINYVFSGGEAPSPHAGDPNADCAVNLADAVYLINYIFRGGQHPLAGCAHDKDC